MILDKLVEATRKRTEHSKQLISPKEMRRRALDMCRQEGEGFSFQKALEGEGIHFICEVKKASPSKGIIAADFPYVEIAREYEKAGADGISVLTETDYFLGHLQYLEEIHKYVGTPLLRKDFTIDDYMIYEAKAAGASAVLLICAILEPPQLKEYLAVARELGLSVLTEAHDEKEVETAVLAGAEIIGVNNRNLKDFTVDINNSIRLRKQVPENILFVAESGIQTPEDIERLRQGNVNGVLIGETLMRCEDKRQELKRLKGEL